MNTKRKHILTLVLTLLFVSWIFMYSKPVSAAVHKCNHGDTININLGDTVVVNQKGVSDKVLNDSYTWIKFTAKDNGILRVHSDSYCASVRLANKKKKPISGKEESLFADPIHLKIVMTDSVYYGIKKGETYYLRAESDTTRGASYSLNLKFTPRSFTGGSKKSKATVIKKKKWMKGLFTIGKKNTRWYKIKLTKKQKANIYINAYGNNEMYFYIWTKKAGGVTRRVYQDNMAPAGKSKYSVSAGTKCTRSPKLPKGTIIYIKVYTKDTLSSGRYEIKWK